MDMEANIITFAQVEKTQLDQLQDMVYRPYMILRTINSLGISHNHLRFINFDRWGAKDVLDHLCYIISWEYQWVYDNLMILGLDFIEMPSKRNPDNPPSLLVIQRWLYKQDITEDMKEKLEKESYFFNYGVDFQSTILWEGNLVTLYTLLQI